MSSERELTPEEKLLALIQQDKRPDPVPSAERHAEPPPASPAPVQPPPAVATPAAAAIPSGTAPARSTEGGTPSPVPVPASVVAPSVAVPAAPVAAVSGRSGGGLERQPGTPVAVAVEPSPKLKLAASPLPPAPKSQPAVSPAPPAPVPGPVATEKVAVPPATPMARPVPSAPPKVARGAINTRMNWPILNRALMLVVLVLLVAVVYSVASIQSDIDKAMVRQVNEAGSLTVQPAGLDVVTPLPFDEYLKKVSGRDIFRLAEASGSASNAAPVQAEFKLVGVSLDGRDAKKSMAILKSKASSQTFFVTVGDAVGNTGFTLDRVSADRAILKKQKQEIEVR